MDRKEVVNLLANELLKIKKVNGYKTDVGNNIYKWRLSPINESNLPAINIIDTEESFDVDDAPAFMKKCLLEINLEIVVQGTIELLYDVLSDIEKCIGANYSLNGQVSFIYPESVLIDAEQNKNFVSFGLYKIKVMYLANLWRD